MEQITLSNGARLLLQHIPEARIASLGFFWGAGSRHETASENGAAHFLEHMSFKGTLRRDAAQLAREADTIGGQLNAYTSKDHTCYYIRCLDRHLDRAADLLCDMMFSSRFAQEDVEVERGVILEEIGMYEDTPEELCAERLDMAVYPKSSLGRPVLGRQSTLSRMTGDWLRSWQRDHYRPEALVVSLAGGFSPKEVDVLTQAVSALEPGPAPQYKPALYTPSITTRKKAIEQNHILWAFPGMSYLDERRYALILLNAILGGGTSSRLFQELRERRGLCYTVYSTLSDHADTGILEIYTALHRDQEGQALTAVREVVDRLAQDGPSQEELDRAREQACAGAAMSLETVQARMNHQGSSLLLQGRVRSLAEILSAYEQVTRPQLRDLAGELFQFNTASLSAVGRVSPPEFYVRQLGLVDISGKKRAD